MFRSLLLTTFVLNCCVAVGQTGSSAADADSAQDEIVRAVESYVAAFNDRDANAVSQHWSDSGEFTAADGTSVRGQENIRQTFETMFADMNDDQRLTVTINRVALVTDEVATEEGSARLGDAPAVHYMAVHKRENDQWKLHSVKEYVRPASPSNYQHLRELEWLIGDWIDHSDAATVESSCRWSQNRNFITRNFRVTIPGWEPLQGTEFIGFDASTNTIRSWMFDSDGGFATSRWTKVGNDWEIHLSQVLADGRTGSAFNKYTPVDENQYLWQSVERSVGGETLPSVPPIHVVRVLEIELEIEIDEVAE